MKQKNTRQTVSIFCIVLAGVLFCLCRYIGEHPGGSSVRSTVQLVPEETEEPGSAADISEDPEAAFVTVYLCGAVAVPGVYTLPEGSRVADGIEAAGGFTEDADRNSLNLAKLLLDEQQIRVLTRAEAETADEGQPGERDGRIDINTAGPEDLMTLPGIGSAKALAIIQYREEHGAFAEASDIMQVPGIKEAAYSKIRDRIKTGSIIYGIQNSGSG